MQLPDLIILALACYLVTDILVNRAAPFGIMTRIRAAVNSDVFRCFYCASVWAGIAVYLLWRFEPQVVYPLAIGAGAVLSWRYTGGNHT